MFWGLDDLSLHRRIRSLHHFLFLAYYGGKMNMVVDGRERMNKNKKKFILAFFSWLLILGFIIFIIFK